MQTRCLFMDDQSIRHSQFRLRRPDWRTTSVFTAAEAIEALKNTRFDVVQLDHDLGEYDADLNELNGMVVVDWITQNLKPDGAPIFVVHSWNTPAAMTMVETLRKHGFDARKERFSP